MAGGTLRMYSYEQGAPLVGGGLKNASSHAPSPSDSAIRGRWNPLTHVRMCSNTLCGAPHSGKGVSKLRGSYGRININYQLVITRYSSKPPPRKRCSPPSPPGRELPPPCTYSNAEEPKKRNHSHPLYRVAERNCVDRLIVIYIPLG